jgi:hypothetical protein
MAGINESGSHGDGSAVWTSAISAALGDGIVPRGQESRARKQRRRHTGQHWPWTRKTAG